MRASSPAKAAALRSGFEPLLDAARAQSGIKSDTELLEYALACVALEDDFGEKFLALRGTVPRDVDLEF